MSAQRLREAAALMRSRAARCQADLATVTESFTVPIGPAAAGFFDHYLTWHPAVALAVADLLEDGATYLEYLEREHPDEARADYGKFFLAVAIAYLGGAA